MKRGLSLAMALTFGISCCSMPYASAHQAYSSIQSNIREEAELEPYAGGKRVGPVHDWELLCKIEGDEALKARVIKSAEEGSLDHVFILACMNMHGKGVDKNQAAAFELFKAAANRGHSNSQNNLGFMFEEGIGTKKDLKQAVAWYKKAADFNNPSALCNLGNMYELGRGLPADEKEALKLYQKSAELGNRIARQNVAGIEFERERLASLPAAPGPSTESGKAPAVVAVVAKPEVPSKTVSANELVLNSLIARSKAAAAAKALASRTATVSPKDKNAKPVVAVIKTPEKPAAIAESAEPVPASVPAAEVKQSESGFSAGSPTLTAILNRLSKGTSLEQPAAAEPVKEAVKEPAKEAVKEVAKEPLKEVAKVEVAKVEVAAAESKVAAKAAPAKKVEEAVKDQATSKLIASMKNQKPKPKLEVVEKKAAEKPVEKIADKPAETKAVEVKPIAVKPTDAKSTDSKTTEPKTADATLAEVKAFEERKSALDTPVVMPKAAIVAEAKPADLKPIESKPIEGKKSALDTPVVLSSAPAKAETRAVTAIATKPENKPLRKPESKPENKPENKSENKPENKSENKQVAKSSPAATAVVSTVASAAPALAVATKGSGSKKSDVLIDKGANRPIRDKWALIVGITDFQDPDIPDLQYSAKDATDFYNYLTKEANFQPDHVRLLLNQQATQRRVLSELGSKFLARVVKPDDLVVLYFSTHGSPSQLDPRGKNYLVASDSDSDDLFATGIEMQKLLDSIQGRVLTDRVLLVMDACHSGFAAPDSKGMTRLGNFKAEDLVQGSGQLVICSSLADERAWESTRYQNGVFTRKLLEGLRSKGSSTPLVDAYAFAREAVGNEVKEDRPGAKQTPILKGKWDGNDLVIATPAFAPQMVPVSVASTIGTDSRSDLIGSASRSSNMAQAGDEEFGSKPNNEAPRSGVIYLDSQYFSVKGDPRTLAKELYDAIKNNPSDPDLYYSRAKALIQLEDWHNAIASISEAIQLSPNRAQYYLARAYINFRMGKKAIAQQDLEQARFYDIKMSNNVRFHM